MAGNSNSGKKLLVERAQAAEMMAAGGMTCTKIAEELGVSLNAVLKWRREPGFMEDVVERSRRLLKANLPDVYKALTTKSKEGKDRHIRIYLDHLEKLEEAKASRASITFTWNGGAAEPNE